MAHCSRGNSLVPQETSSLTTARRSFPQERTVCRHTEQHSAHRSRTWKWSDARRPHSSHTFQSYVPHRPTDAGTVSSTTGPHCIRTHRMRIDTGRPLIWTLRRKHAGAVICTRSACRSRRRFHQCCHPQHGFQMLPHRFQAAARSSKMTSIAA